MASFENAQILWDVIDHRITIISGDRVFGLSERFRNREDGMRAAEAFCRNSMARDARRAAG
jgi:hypothetical protein